MNLLNEIVEGLKEDDLFFLWSKDITIHENEIISEHRWYDRRRVVVSREDSPFVAVEYNEGSTEMQEDADPEGEAYYVKPVEVTVTKYEKVES